MVGEAGGGCLGDVHMRMDLLSTGLYDCAGRRGEETERRGGSRDDQCNTLYEGIHV